MTTARAGDLEYACARIGARYGARPDAAAWRRIESVRDLAAMLDAARATPLRPWTAGLSVDTDAHAVERVLRGHWRALGGEIVAWMPARWHPAVEWSAFASQLPVLDHVRRGEELPPGVRDDPVYRDWTERFASFRGRGAIASLVSAHDTDALIASWRAEWRRRLPASHRREAPRLAELASTVSRYVGDMRAAPPGDATAIVRAFGGHLERVYRRAVLEPTAAFVYLALAALDLARLRGEIVRRVLFPKLAPAP